LPIWRLFPHLLSPWWLSASPCLLPASPCSCIQHRRELSQLKCKPAEYESDAWCKDGQLRVHAGGRKRSTAQDHQHLAAAGQTS
jgi:hypothetical protein